MKSSARIGAAALLVLPGALAAYLGFTGGGFFVGGFSLVAALLAVLMVLRITLAERPFAGYSAISILAIALLALFAVWTLVSGAWSDSGGRAVIEFVRALSYLLAVGLFASLPLSSARLTWMVRAVAVGLTVVCAAGLTSRIAADVWTIAPNVSNDRLSFPVTYWNALGMMAAGAALLCFHLTADEREPLVSRSLAAAALPVLLATLLFTFSRGAIAAGLIGLAIYLVMGRPRGLVGALLATSLPVAVTLKKAYDADLVQSESFAAPAAVDQGHEVALVVIGAAVVAGIARLALAPLDRRIARLRLPQPGRGVKFGGVAAALAVVIVALAVVGAPGYVSRQYDGFVQGRQLKDKNDLRARLTNPANNGRLDHWNVALDAYRENRVRGSGAGTYQLLWARDRPTRFTVVDGHSLYVEVLGELGLVGLVLIAAALLTLLVGLARRAARHAPRRPLYAAVLAVTVAWAVHAGRGLGLGDAGRHAVGPLPGCAGHRSAAGQAAAGA